MSDIYTKSVVGRGPREFTLSPGSFLDLETIFFTNCQEMSELWIAQSSWPSRSDQSQDALLSPCLCSGPFPLWDQQGRCQALGSTPGYTQVCLNQGQSILRDTNMGISNWLADFNMPHDLVLWGHLHPHWDSILRRDAQTAP